MLSKIMYLFLALILISTLLIAINFTKVKRLYHAITIFDEGKIAHHFMNMDAIGETSLIKRSDDPKALPTKGNYKLPEKLNTKLFSGTTNEFLEKSETTGLLIIHEDSIIYESYFKGLKPEIQHISWSVAKSFISALMGIALEEGKFKDVQETVSDYLPQFNGTGYEGVKIKDLLQMSSGVGFNEDYGDFNSDINRFSRTFAFGKSFDEFSLSLKRERQPGTFNHYVSIDTQVLGMLLIKWYNKSLSELLKEKVWDPMQMEFDAKWLVDNKGVELALGGLNVCMRDYAKFGLMFLKKGNWFGKQIVPESWVEKSIEIKEEHLMPGENPNSSNIFGYGYQWWIPENSEGDFFASGIYNQHIYINPKRELVIVKLSANYHFKKNSQIEKEEHIDFLTTLAKTFPLKSELEN